MADYINTTNNTIPDPASPGFIDGDTITLQNGSKFSRQSGRWEPVRFQTVGQQSKEVPVTATLSDGKLVISAGGQDITDQIGTGMTYTVRNLDNATVTRIMLPSAPAELMLNWYDSTGSSGNLRYVLEAASLADATARLNDDTAHGELAANGSPAIVKFSPTTFPVSIYVRASSAVGAGSNIFSLLAKVTQ